MCANSWFHSSAFIDGNMYFFFAILIIVLREKVVSLTRKEYLIGNQLLLITTNQIKPSANINEYMLIALCNITFQICQ